MHGAWWALNAQRMQDQANSCGIPFHGCTMQAQTRSACRSLLTKAFASPDAGAAVPLAGAAPVVAAVEQALYEKHEFRTSKVGSVLGGWKKLERVPKWR